jgi:pimeloyl-ACP methyl ester carboxylesterase
LSAFAPFTIAVPEAVLDDLRQRLERVRWPDQIEGTGWDLGTDLAYARDLCDYWRTAFNWRAAEAELNEWPNYLTQVDGQQFHLIHARSPHPDALPLLLTHGWPGSVVEFLDVLGSLTDPAAHGGDPADAFHVVCPSLPGYTWSGPTTERGWHIGRVADALDTLMIGLGYPRYGAQGGDWGALATARLARQHPDHLAGIHLNLPIIDLPAEPAVEGLTEDEIAALIAARDFQRTETGYSAIQGTKPQTLSYALNDSPAGLAAWIIEKFRTWSDCEGDPASVITRDRLLTNITAYWVTGTAGSSIRLYRESMEAGVFGGPGGRVDVPTGVAVFPKELVHFPRSWVAAAYDLRHWTEQPRGGHFAAMEQPALFVADVRAFFRTVR